MSEWRGGFLVGYVLGAVAGYYFRRMCECWKMEREYRRNQSANAQPHAEARSADSVQADVRQGGDK